MCYCLNVQFQGQRVNISIVGRLGYAAKARRNSFRHELKSRDCLLKYAMPCFAPDLIKCR